MIKDNKAIFYLLIMCSSLYMLWMFIVPFDQGPDESLRFDIGRFIYQYHSLPQAGDPRLGDFGHGISYAPLPQLPYIIGGFLMIIFGGIISEEHLFYVHRLISVIPGVVSVYLVYLIGREMKLDRSLQIFIAALFAFVPQYAFLNSYVNQESFSMCANLFVIYMWFVGKKTNWNKKSLILIGVGLSSSLLSYLNGYVIFPVTALVILLTIKDEKKVVFKKIGFLILIIFILSGWWFIRNAIIYNGDFLGLKTMTYFGNQNGTIGLRPMDRNTPLRQGISLKEMIIDQNWWQISYRSFWAVFGGMNLPVKEQFYYYITLLHLVSLVGVVIAFVNKVKLFFKSKLQPKKIVEQSIFYVCFFLIIVMTLALSLYYSYFSDFQAQGRYLFPALFSVIFFIGIGFQTLFKQSVQNVIYFLVIFCIFLLNIYSLFKVVLPKYYF